MGKKSPPKAPDPGETAEAQAKANRITQFTPSGNLLYGKLDETGQFVPSTGDDQAAAYVQETPFGQNMRNLSELGGFLTAGDVIGRAGEIPDPARLDDISGDAMTQATFQKGRSLLDPIYDKRHEQTQQMLADRGLPLGGEAYDDVNRELSLNESEAYNRLALDSVAAGRQEQSRLYGLARDERSTALGELASVLGGQYNPSQTPQGFPGGSQIDVKGPINTAYQGQLNAHNQQQQSSQGLMTGLFGLGAAAFAPGALGLLSDERLKKDIEPLGDDESALEAIERTPVSRWRYKEGIDDGAQHIGPMAGDAQAEMGVGDGRTLPLVDYMGTMIRALQEVGARLKAVEGSG